MVLNVTKVNGSESSATLSGFFSMYVTEDVFTRIPLIEEFTGLRCSNCPLMSYYLDVALEEYADPYVYVAHHAGFADDDFTTDADKEILYLFGNKGTYNPAIMYDRTVLKGELLPVYGVTELSPAPYLAALSEVAACPAQAMVLVDVTRENGNVSCRVHGKVSKVMMRTGDDFYLSAYIVEDGIPEEKYPQEGLDVEGAPEDLSDRFAHNGVIRHNFCQDPAGDRLTPDGDGSFSVDFPQRAVPHDWVWDNCQVVAFVHKRDKENLRENYVLNAGSDRLNEIALGVNPVTVQQDNVLVSVDRDRRIRTSAPVRDLAVYDLQGRCRDGNSVLSWGLRHTQCQHVRPSLCEEDHCKMTAAQGCLPPIGYKGLWGLSFPKDVLYIRWVSQGSPYVKAMLRQGDCVTVSQDACFLRY